MTVKQLKEQLIGISDDAVVVTDDRDGWASECEIEFRSARDTGHGQFDLMAQIDNIHVLLFT